MKSKEWQKEQWSEERPVWVIGIVLFVMLFCVGIVEYVAPDFLHDVSPSCFIRRNVGLYCTGCGGTRAVFALLHGHFLQSLYYNVAVLYVAVFYGVYVIRGAIYLISKGKYPFMKFRVWYVFVGLAIVVIQAIVKNIALYVYHYEWMV